MTPMTPPGSANVFRCDCRKICRSKGNFADETHNRNHLHLQIFQQ